MELLKDAFTIKDSSINAKNVLIFDDIFCAGETLTAITKTVKEQGKASNIYVLALTKTRNKR
jgi:predicted amidophosphoribosyltransferase